MNCGFCGKDIKDYAKKSVTQCLKCNDNICGKCSDAGTMYCEKHSSKRDPLFETSSEDEIGIQEYGCSYARCSGIAMPPDRYCEFHKKFEAIPEDKKTLPQKTYPGVASDIPYPSFSSMYGNLVRDRGTPDIPLHHHEQTRTIPSYSLYGRTWGQQPREPTPEELEEIKEKNGMYIAKLFALQDNIPDDFKSKVTDEIERVGKAKFVIPDATITGFMYSANLAISNFMDKEDMQKAPVEKVTDLDSILEDLDLLGLPEKKVRFEDIPLQSEQETPIQENTPVPIQENTPVPIQENTPVPIQENTPVLIQENTPVPIQENTPVPIQEPDNIVQGSFALFEKNADSVLAEQQKQEDKKTFIQDVVKAILPHVQKTDFGKITSQLKMITRSMAEFSMNFAALKAAHTRNNQNIESIYARLAVIEQNLMIRNPVRTALTYEETNSMISVQGMTERLNSIETSVGTCRKLITEVVKAIHD